MRRVDAGLAADGGIDLRQQRRRHLHEVHAAAHDRRGEAGEIADHAAAERDHHVAALEAGIENAVDHILQCLETLRRLARRDGDLGRLDAGFLQALRDGRQMVAGDVFVGDDRRAGSRQHRGDMTSGLGEKAGSDQDVVGAVAERDVDGLGGNGGGHCPDAPVVSAIVAFSLPSRVSQLASAATTLAAMSSLEMSCDSTSTSASA